MKITENKPHSIHLRLSEEQYAFCKENADMMGIGVSEFLRIMVNSVMVTANKVQNIKLGDLKDEDNKNDFEHQL